jgi:hypothetical protein
MECRDKPTSHCVTNLISVDNVDAKCVTLLKSSQLRNLALKMITSLWRRWVGMGIGIKLLPWVCEYWLHRVTWVCLCIPWHMHMHMHSIAHHITLVSELITCTFSTIPTFNSEKISFTCLHSFSLAFSRVAYLYLAESITVTALSFTCVEAHYNC